MSMQYKIAFTIEFKPMIWNSLDFGAIQTNHCCLFNISKSCVRRSSIHSSFRCPIPVTIAQCVHWTVMCPRVQKLKSKILFFLCFFLLFNIYLILKYIFLFIIPSCTDYKEVRLILSWQ